MRRRRQYPPLRLLDEPEGAPRMLLEHRESMRPLYQGLDAAIRTARKLVAAAQGSQQPLPQLVTRIARLSGDPATVLTMTRTLHGEGWSVIVNDAPHGRLDRVDTIVLNLEWLRHGPLAAAQAVRRHCRRVRLMDLDGALHRAARDVNRLRARAQEVQAEADVRSQALDSMIEERQVLVQKLYAGRDELLQADQAASTARIRRGSDPDALSIYEGTRYSE